MYKTAGRNKQRWSSSTRRFYQDRWGQMGSLLLMKARSGERPSTNQQCEWRISNVLD